MLLDDLFQCSHNHSAFSHRWFMPRDASVMKISPPSFWLQTNSVGRFCLWQMKYIYHCILPFDTTRCCHIITCHLLPSQCLLRNCLFSEFNALLNTFTRGNISYLINVNKDQVLNMELWSLYQRRYKLESWGWMMHIHPSISCLITGYRNYLFNMTKLNYVVYKGIFLQN
jgi:hypothetical protein